MGVMELLTLTASFVPNPEIESILEACLATYKKETKTAATIVTLSYNPQLLKTEFVI